MNVKVQAVIDQAAKLTTDQIRRMWPPPEESWTAQEAALASVPDPDGLSTQKAIWEALANAMERANELGASDEAVGAIWTTVRQAVLAAATWDLTDTGPVTPADLVTLAAPWKKAVGLRHLVASVPA